MHKYNISMRLNDLHSSITNNYKWYLLGNINSLTIDMETVGVYNIYS